MAVEDVTRDGSAASIAAEVSHWPWVHSPRCSTRVVRCGSAPVSGRWGGSTRRLRSVPDPARAASCPATGASGSAGGAAPRRAGGWWTSDRHSCVKAWWYDGIKAAGRYYRYTSVRGEHPRQE